METCFSSTINLRIKIPNAKRQIGNKNHGYPGKKKNCADKLIDQNEKLYNRIIVDSDLYQPLFLKKSGVPLSRDQAIAIELIEDKKLRLTKNLLKMPERSLKELNSPPTGGSNSNSFPIRQLADRT